jgi:catechol 2,3-dioxygenase-like lactoylglutathione lyase family enzyme
MIRIANAQLWVHDQDEALAFYTEKLGMEVRADVTVEELGNFRWLTVSPPGQEDVSIVLMAIPGRVPGPARPGSAALIRLMNKTGNCESLRHR